MPFYDPTLDRLVQDLQDAGGGGNGYEPLPAAPMNPDDYAVSQDGTIKYKGPLLRELDRSSQDTMPATGAGVTYDAATGKFTEEAPKPMAPEAMQPDNLRTGGSVAHTGFSQDQYAKVDQSLNKGLDKDEQKAKAQTDAEAAQEKGYVAEGADAAAKAQEGINRATWQEDDPTTPEDESLNSLYGVKAQGERVIGKLAEDLNSDYSTAMGVAQAGVKAAQGKYLEQMQKVGAMRVDPSRLMKNAGFTGRMGMGLAAFAEGYLGAKGIKINAVQNITSAIDEDIQAQLTDIEQGKTVTEGFKTLYDMAKEDATNRSDLLLRLRGFALESAKSKIASESLRFEGKLSVAEGEAKIAAIEQEQAKSFQEITRHAQDAYITQVKNAQDNRIQRGRLAIESQRLAFDQQQYADAKAAAANKDSRVFVDSSDPMNATVIGEVRDEIQGEALAAAQNKASETAGYSKMGRDLRDKMIAAEVRQYTGPFKQFLSENPALYAEYMRYFAVYRKSMTGMAASKDEDKRIREGVPYPEMTGVSAKEAASILNQKTLEDLNAADTQLSGLSKPGTYRGFANDWKTEAKGFSPDAPPDSPQGKLVKSMGKNNPGAFEAVDNPTQPAQFSWSGYLIENPKATVIEPGHFDLGPGSLDRKRDLVPNYVAKVSGLLELSKNPGVSQKERDSARESLDLLQADPSVAVEIRDYTAWAVGKAGLTRKYQESDMGQDPNATYGGPGNRYIPPSR